jgi:hypothetical protein
MRMKKASILCFVLALFGTGLARAESAAGGPAAKLPPEVVVFAEVSDLLSAEAKLMDFVQQIAPEAPMERFTNRMPEDVFRTTDPSTVDMSKPLQVVLLAPPYLHEATAVFSVTDAARYLDSLEPALTKQRDEGAVHVYARGGTGRPLVIGIEGNRAVMGRNAEAVGKVLALVKAGSLSAGTVFQGSDAGGMVRLKQLLGALDAEGKNPFTVAKIVGGQFAGMGAPGGMDMRGIVNAYVDAAESLALQMETVSGRFSMDLDAATAAVRVEPVAGSRLAKYMAEMPGGDLDLLQYLPADSIFVFAGHIGDLSPLVDWYGKVLAAMAPAAAGPPGKGLLDAARQSLAYMGNEVAFSVSSGGEGPLLLSSAMKVKDAQGMERLLQDLPARMAEFRSVQEQMGVVTNLKVTPKAVTYDGLDITEMEFQYEFHPRPGPLGAMMAAQQKAAVTAFWGTDVKGYGAFRGDTYFYTQGTGALDALKAMLDGKVKPAAGSQQMAAALKGMPPKPVAAGYISLQGAATFALSMVRTMTSQMQGQPGQPGMPAIPKVQFAEAPPEGFAAWVAEGGAFETQVRIPLQAVVSVVDGFRQMQRPQEPFMQKP